jgi:hypothetical protein
MYYHYTMSGVDANFRALYLLLYSSTISDLVILSDVKDALDNMNAINQYYVHMHLLVL